MVAWESPGVAQQVTVNTRSLSNHDKAPLTWREGEVCYLMNMALLPRKPGGDWALQPTISKTWGQPDAGSPSGWSTRHPDGKPLGKIYAFGGAGPTDGTKSVDWGDGCFLRVSKAAAFKYNLPEGTILYSTRLNTSDLGDPRSADGASRGYGTRYRIFVFMSKDGARIWTLLPPVALSSKGPGEGGKLVGLWSNFLFERSDGTIQVYYDNELAAWSEPGGRSRGESWVAMQSLVPGPALAWTGQASEIIVDGHQQGRPKPRTGMASVSEKSPGDGTMIMSVEDVNFYDEVGHPGNGRSRFQGIVRVLKSSDGGVNWSHVHSFINPRGFNNFAPYHIRSRITGDLILIYRSDIGRMDDPANPNYDPYVSAKQGANTGNARWVLANLQVVRSSDDGVTWKPLESAPGTPYQPGGSEFAYDPGVAELVLSPTSSTLIFQWGQFLGGLKPGTPGYAAKSWVQALTIQK